jgi:LysM repeat protein
LVAKEQKVALYDYFEISGGIHAMLNWSKDGLSNKDQCHLSTTGYKFKGELFFNGIMNGYLKYLESSPASYVNYSIDSDTMNRRKWVVNKSIGKNCGVIAEGDKIDNYKNTTNPVSPSITTNNTTNTSEFIVVKAGESLSILSKRHSISIQDLKSINGLKSDNITVGQKLKIKR